jgi:hypothetical protein
MSVTIDTDIDKIIETKILNKDNEQQCRSKDGTESILLRNKKEKFKSMKNNWIPDCYGY